KRTTGESARLARSRSRAISEPRDEIPRDPCGLLEDVRLASHPATSHQDDAVADHRVHDVYMGGVDPIAQVLPAGRGRRPARIAWPVEVFVLETGQWATRVPVRARSSMSDGSSQQPWAAITSFARNPMLSKYFAGRTPVSVTQSSTSRFVSERCVWISEPVLSASSRIWRRESFDTV